VDRENGGRPLAIAHRAGNDLGALTAALALGVDLIEADVRPFRGALEMRHARSMGPHLLWDRWRVSRRRRATVPTLRELLTTAPGALMLDLKGQSTTLAPEVAALLRDVSPDVPVTVCTKQWSMLDAFADAPHVRQILSAANRPALQRLRARLRHRPAAGVSVRLSLVTAALVAELRERAPLVMVWPVRTAADLDRARQIGATGIISGNPAVLRDVLTA
jgi:glycerophosphoryl diester phosphodiesterase